MSASSPGIRHRVLPALSVFAALACQVEGQSNSFVDTDDVVEVGVTVGFTAGTADYGQISDVDTYPADLDGSGAVDFADILAILSAWGNAGGPEDLDGSGTVGFGDILVVLGEWGPCR